LIVMPGENAIFVKGGIIEQVFESGTYQLSTQNYPFISRLRNAFTGGISTFNCVVFFVKTAHTSEIRWGTDSPIQVRDKLLGIATKLRARGAYRVTISNPAKFLEKMLGNNYAGFTKDALTHYFVSEFQSKIKSVIAKAINDSNTEILGIDSRLMELSELVKPLMQESMDAYGLRCVSFSIVAIDIDDNELRTKYDEIGMDAIQKMRNAQADRMVMDTLGDKWAQQQAVNIMSTMANNLSQTNNEAMNFGVGMASAAMFGGMAQQMFAPMQQGYGAPTPQGYGAPTPQGYGAPAPQGYGAPAPQGYGAPATEDPMETLAKLKKLLDAGLIEQAEYDKKKMEILSRM